MLKKPVNLALVVSRLNKGGTEVQILELVRALRPEDYRITLFTFYGDNQLWTTALKIPQLKCISLHKKSRWDYFFFFRFLLQLKKQKPQIIYSFLTTSNLICLFMKPFFPTVKLILGFRTSKTDYSHFDKFTKLVAQLEGKLARFASCIIANSHAGKAYAVSMGFPEKNTLVIANGMDTERFCPDSEKYFEMREKLGVTKDELLVGIVGRFDPLKDHKTFLKAARIVGKKRSDVKFLIVGVGETCGNLKAKYDNGDLKGKLIFTGLVENPVPYFQAMDLYCSSSTTEGFSNAIAEAMASGVPSVVTDVGDSKIIVGETGWVVEPQNPEELAQGMLLQFSRIELAREEMRREARNRIVKNFSRAHLARQADQVFQNLIHHSKNQKVDISSPIVEL